LWHLPFILPCRHRYSIVECEPHQVADYAQ